MPALRCLASNDSSESFSKRLKNSCFIYQCNKSPSCTPSRFCPICSSVTHMHQHLTAGVCVCCVRWQTRRDYSIGSCWSNQLQVNVRGMAIHEEDCWPIFQRAGYSRQEQLFEPAQLQESVSVPSTQTQIH